MAQCDINTYVKQDNRASRGKDSQASHSVSSRSNLMRLFKRVRWVATGEEADVSVWLYTSGREHLDTHAPPRHSWRSGLGDSLSSCNIMTNGPGYTTRKGYLFNK